MPAGSLTVSITDMRAPLVGGSGGVYALCSAHLANVVMVSAAGHGGARGGVPLGGVGGWAAWGDVGGDAVGWQWGWVAFRVGGVM